MQFTLNMANETKIISVTCLGFEMKNRHVLGFHGILSYTLAWANCGLNILLAGIAVFYNIKILVDFRKHRRKWSFSNMLLFNLSITDAVVGLVILPSRTLLFGAALLGETAACEHLLLILFESIRSTVSTASFHAVFMVSFERYVSVVHCMKCTVIMTKTRTVSAILLGWLLSSALGLLTLFTPRAVQLVLSVHIFCGCLTLGALNLKMHMVAKSQRTKIYLQRLSVRRQDPVKKYLKTQKPVAMVITAITLCYFPQAVISFIAFITNSSSLDSLQLWSATLFFAASSLNPFVYFKQVKKSPFHRKRAMYISENGGYCASWTVLLIFGILCNQLQNKYETI